ncbi:MAG: hypothetical protein P8179_13005 [Candidatus Thiodiazotropha sp.]|jgi:hypothetical protein
MNEYSLNKYKSSEFLDDFKSKNIEIIPYQEAGLYRFQNGKKTKIENRNSSFTMAQLEQLHHRGIVEIKLHEEVEHGYCEVGFEDRNFGVRLETKDGQLIDGIMEIAIDVISKIVEMDSEVREKTKDSNENYEEAIAYIDISLREVELHYYANTVNTEWGAYFVRQENGTWFFEGLG